MPSASVLFLTADLVFASRAQGAGRACGAGVRVLGNAAAWPAELAESAPRLVLVDLGLPGLDLSALAAAVKALPGPPRLVAYAPHVLEETLAAARAAGCPEVLTRGQFDRALPELVRGAAG